MILLAEQAELLAVVHGVGAQVVDRALAALGVLSERKRQGAGVCVLRHLKAVAALEHYREAEHGVIQYHVPVHVLNRLGAHEVLADCVEVRAAHAVQPEHYPVGGAEVLDGVVRGAGHVAEGQLHPVAGGVRADLRAVGHFAAGAYVQHAHDAAQHGDVRRVAVHGHDVCAGEHYAHCGRHAGQGVLQASGAGALLGAAYAHIYRRLKLRRNGDAVISGFSCVHF